MGGSQSCFGSGGNRDDEPAYEQPRRSSRKVRPSDEDGDWNVDLKATEFIAKFHAPALQFARTEGIIPAPEPTYAIAAAIREALECTRTGEKKVILMAMCGHGHFDLAAYERYLRGDMVDLSHSDDKLEEALAAIPKV